MTPAGTSNELDVQNGWEENTHTHTHTKDETAAYFSKYLAEIAPRKVEVRSDGGGEFSKGAFGALCTTGKIRQEFTTVDSPQYNGVAERQMAITEAAALAARI